jgi:uncharacterized protein YkwD
MGFRRVHCPLRAFALGLATTFVGLLAAPLSTSAAPTSTSATVAFVPRPDLYASDVQNFVNAYRRRAGVPPVSLQWQLNRAAQSHAYDMARRNVLSHIGSDGSSGGTRISRTGYRWWTWGENVAAGQTSPSQVVWAWLSSPSHRAVMLDRRFQQMGLGRAVASNGRVYWTLDLASPG